MANNFPVTLTDGSGFIWDFISDGRIVDGGSADGTLDDSFDGAYRLGDSDQVFFDTDGISLETEEGRQHLFEGVLPGDLAVSRKIFVPDDAGWARFYDSFTNTGSVQKTYTITYDVDLGSDGSTFVLDSSSGDTTYDDADFYVISDDSADGSGGSDPVVTSFFGDGTLQSNADGSSSTVGFLSRTFTFTLDPGETTAALFFSAQNASLSDAEADLADFIAPSGAMLQGLSTAEVENIENYSGLSATRAAGAVVDFTDAAMSTASASSGFDQPIDLASYNSHSTSTYQWTTSDGHTVTGFGTGIDVNAGFIPTSGIFNKFTIDLNSDNAVRPDIVIDNVLILSSQLSYTQGTTADSMFWAAVLDGDTTVTGNTGPFGSGMLGDYKEIATAGFYRADNDTFTNAGVDLNYSFGDALAVRAGTLLAGDDRFTGIFSFVFTDVTDVFNAGTVVIGGDDIVTVTGNSSDFFNTEIVLDAALVSGATVIGGDDTVNLDPSVTIQTGVFGDVANITNSAVVVAGDDSIKSGDGSDYLYGDFTGAATGTTVKAGNDTIEGGGGNDSIYGDGEAVRGADFEAGDDLLRGGDDHDQIWGDFVDGESDSGGNDTIYGDGGNDTIYGGFGDDRLFGGTGDDEFHVDDGDVVSDVSGEDKVFGTGSLFDFGDHSGIETFEVTSGMGLDYMVIGDAEDNEIILSDGNDTVMGGAGDDLVIDILDGGFSTDLVTYLGARDEFSFALTDGSGVLVDDLVTNNASGDEGTDLLFNIERVSFGENDSIHINSLFDTQNKLNDDGTGDILMRHATTGQVVFGASDGTGVPLPVSEVSATRVGAEWTFLGARDLDQDGDADLGWRSNSGLVAWWEIEDGEQVSGGLVQSAPISLEWESLAVDDFDRDGDGDFLWKSKSGFVAWWEIEDGVRTGGGLVDATPIPNEWNFLGSGDVDKDGDADLIWQSNSGLVAYWEIEDGRKTSVGLVQPQLIATDQWTFLAAGDLDGDGDSDFLWQSNSGILAAWEIESGLNTGARLVKGNSALGPAESFLGLVDFNGDRTQDVIIESHGVMQVGTVNDFIAALSPPMNVFTTAPNSEFDFLI